YWFTSVLHQWTGRFIQFYRPGWWINPQLQLQRHHRFFTQIQPGLQSQYLRKSRLPRCQYFQSSGFSGSDTISSLEYGVPKRSHLPVYSADHTRFPEEQLYMARSDQQKDPGE